MFLINEGYCPICEHNQRFYAEQAWLRDYYFCENCLSIPRQRAIVYILTLIDQNWKQKYIHESSPSINYFSHNCPNYSCSFFFENEELGKLINGYRCENLEKMTFLDETFDIFITQDVMEHVFEPEQVFQEVMRVLRPGGMYIFTTPKYKNIVKSFCRAKIVNGKIEYLHPPEYHGNPIGDGKSLVTWYYGADFEDLIKKWSGYLTSTYVIRDRRLGIDGEFLEVFVTIKDSRNLIKSSTEELTK